MANGLQSVIELCFELFGAMSIAVPARAIQNYIITAQRGRNNVLISQIAVPCTEQTVFLNSVLNLGHLLRIMRFGFVENNLPPPLQWRVVSPGERMASLDAVIQQLREERNRTQSQVERLDHAISVLEGSVTTKRSSGRRTMSADARRRIAEAQRRRWAKVKAGRKRRSLSPAARARIVAAQKARWAEFHAAKKK
jgi:hypothetical protein